MARKQYGVPIEVEDSKSELEVTKWSDTGGGWCIFGAAWMFGMGNGESFGVALGSMWPADCGGITLPAYFHSFASTSTSADDCKVMECITGRCTVLVFVLLCICRIQPPLNVLTSRRSVGLPFKYLRLYLFNISIAYFRTKARARTEELTSSCRSKGSAMSMANRKAQRS